MNSRRSTLAFVFALMVSTFAPRAPLSAQTKPCPKGLGGVLCRLDNTIKKADSTGTGQNDPRAGANVRIVSPPTLENPDLYSAKYDTSGSGSRREQRPCGPTRSCVAGWDLRALSILAPTDTVPETQAFPVTVTVENRGKVASPASEIAVCLAAEYQSIPTECRRHLALIELASLLPGERAVIKQAVRLNAEESDFRIAAFIDPDNGTGETNRGNNVVATNRMSSESPEIEWLAFDVPGTVRPNAPIPVRLRIRNRSFHASTSPLEVGFFGAGYFLPQDARFVLAVPAIGPRQIMTVELLVSTGNNTQELSVAARPVAAEWSIHGPTVRFQRR